MQIVCHISLNICTQLLALIRIALLSQWSVHNATYASVTIATPYICDTPGVRYGQHLGGRRGSTVLCTLDVATENQIPSIRYAFENNSLPQFTPRLAQYGPIFPLQPATLACAARDVQVLTFIEIAKGTAGPEASARAFALRAWLIAEKIQLRN